MQLSSAVSSSSAWLWNRPSQKRPVHSSSRLAHRAIGSFHGTARLSTWLHRIVVNEALMRLRRKRRRPEESIDDLLPRLRNTLFLAGYAAVIAIPLSVGLGVLAAINEGKLSDRLSNILTLIAISLPEFFIAYLLIIFFSVQFHWFPSLAMVSNSMSFGDRVFQTTLPAITLTLLVAAHMLRMTRSSVLSVMSTPYIEMAFLKGAPRKRVIVTHALPNAAAPIITVIALNMAYLVVGVVVIEAVFVYPGLGQYMVDGVSKRDVPVIQACGLTFATVFVLLNTLADILVILVNPRLRHQR